MADRFAPGLFEADHYSPTRNKCSHWRKSPLKPMLSAIRKLEIIARSACRSCLPVRKLNGSPCASGRGESRTCRARLSWESSCSTVCCTSVSFAMNVSRCIIVKYHDMLRIGNNPSKRPLHLTRKSRCSETACPVSNLVPKSAEIYTHPDLSRARPCATICATSRYRLARCTNSCSPTGDPLFMRIHELFARRNITQKNR